MYKVFFNQLWRKIDKSGSTLLNTNIWRKLVLLVSLTSLQKLRHKNFSDANNKSIGISSFSLFFFIKAVNQVVIHYIFLFCAVILLCSLFFSLFFWNNFIYEVQRKKNITVCYFFSGHYYYCFYFPIIIFLFHDYYKNNFVTQIRDY